MEKTKINASTFPVDLCENKFKDIKVEVRTIINRGDINVDEYFNSTTRDRLKLFSNNKNKFSAIGFNHEMNKFEDDSESSLKAALTTFTTLMMMSYRDFGKVNDDEFNKWF